MHGKSVAKVLTILCLSTLVRPLAMDIFIPCLPTVAAYFAVPFSTAQWVMTVYFLGAGLGQLIMGPLSDMFGRRPILLACTIIFALSSLICAHTNSIWQLVATRLLQGIGACGTTVITMAIVRDVFDDQTTPRAYSYLNGVISLAPTLGPFLGGTLFMLTGDWRACFYFLLAFSIVTLGVNYLFVTETCKQRMRIVPSQLFAHYREVLSLPQFWIYVYAGIAGLGSLVMFFSVSSVLLIERLNMAENIFGIYFGCNFAVYLITNMLSPKLQKQLGVSPTIFLGCISILCGALSMLVLDQMFGLTVMGFLTPMFLVTFGVGLMFGPCIAMGVQPFRHIAGIASASYGALIYCSGGIITGILMQFQIYTATPYAIAMILLNSANLIILAYYFNYLPRKILRVTN